MKRLVWIGASLMLMLAPLATLAADGYVTVNLNMRAGPDADYPRIATVPVGSAVSVQGCTDGFEWCDVISGNDRGWVAGDYIQYEYQDRRVALPSYGAQIGIPIVSFVISSYWNSHYQNRSFYRQRNNWYHRPMSHRPPPRPVARPPAHRPPTYRPASQPRPTVHRPAPPRPSVGHGQRPSPRPPANRPAPNQAHGKPASGSRPNTGHRPSDNNGDKGNKGKRDKRDDKHGH